MGDFVVGDDGEAWSDLCKPVTMGPINSHTRLSWKKKEEIYKLSKVYIVNQVLFQWNIFYEVIVPFNVPKKAKFQTSQ